MGSTTAMIYGLGKEMLPASSSAATGTGRVNGSPTV